MARKGKFGRSASGSQNLSALIYALLKEERQDQENNMITAYNNNMRSGSAAGVFTADGTTRPATAMNIVSWYISQAAAADSVGDAGGAQKLRNKAEEFRIAALRDQEQLLDAAYQNGNAIDLTLVGGSGNGKITDAEYEKFISRIMSDGSMTPADKERLSNKMFTISYTSAATDMVNGFKEGKFNADQLVKFYDKELKRAVEAGFTQESQTYRDIEAARASAIERRESDAAQARIDRVDNELRAETDAIAKGIQRLIKDTAKDFFDSKTTDKLLQMQIGKGDGDEWLNNFSEMSQSAGVNVQSLIEMSMSSNGITNDQAAAIMQALEQASDDVQALKDQGYGKELGTWPGFISSLATVYGRGIFVATSKKHVEGLVRDLSSNGASISVPGAADPVAIESALNRFVGAIGGAGVDNIANSQIPEIIVGINNGDASRLFGDNTEMSIDQMISKISEISGAEEYDVAKRLTTYLVGVETNDDRTELGPIGDALTQMGIKTSTLLRQIGSGNSMTVADVLRLKIEGTVKPRIIAEDSNLVKAYVWDPSVRYFVFDALNKLDARGPNYVMSFDKKGQPYFVRTINATQDGNVKLIPVPGGGGQAGLVDSNDIIRVKKNDSVFYNFTWKDLENIKGWASDIQNNQDIDQFIRNDIMNAVGTNTEMPRLNISPDTGDFIDNAEATMGDWLVRLVSNDRIMETLAQSFGPGWLDSRTAASDKTTSDASYKSDITELFAQFGPQTDWAPVVQKWLAEQGINDGTGKYTALLVEGLTKDVRNTPPAETPTGGTKPPANGPEFASGDAGFLGQVIRDQRGGRDMNTGIATPGTGAGGPGYGGTPTGPVQSPVSDYLAYTMRNLGAQKLQTPGAFTETPELRDSRPPQIGAGKPAAIITKAPPAIPKAPAPRLASAPTSFRTTPSQARFATGGGRYVDRIAL